MEMYYYDVTIRLLILIVLSSLVGVIYLMYLKGSDKGSFFKHAKYIYGLQIFYWFLFLSNIFDRLLPNNFIGYFIFEGITLLVIFMSFVFLLWDLVTNKRKNELLILFSVPMVFLFVLSLGVA